MIHTRLLTKDFAVSRSQTVHAVRGIDLDIATGELVAVLGPNGAGKTTTMRMLTTLIPPTSGTATVAGYDVVAGAAQVRRRIGYVGQGNGAGHTQRARDELYTQALVYGLDRRAARRRADELLGRLDLTELATRKVSDLSGGQRRRLDVAIGMVDAPAGHLADRGHDPVRVPAPSARSTDRLGPARRVRHRPGLPQQRVATAVRQQDWMFWAVHQTVIFPLMILSGMLLPLDTGPAWMRTAAAANPLAYVVDAERALFAGDLTSPVIVAGWVAALSTAVVGLVVGVHLMTRSAD